MFEKQKKKGGFWDFLCAVVSSVVFALIEFFLIGVSAFKFADKDYIACVGALLLAISLPCIAYCRSSALVPDENLI